jgi:metal-responsive CopG/Arc/MetJ family transcriptional regulator
MSRKTKINVLLPMKMVGELEELSRLGKRSKFITDAIRSKLDGQDAFDINDFPTRNIAVILQNRLIDLQNRGEECEMSDVLSLVLRKWIL